ncbi:MAG: penicillin acylase family protein [Alphaproteobacteria bacterium]
MLRHFVGSILVLLLVVVAIVFGLFGWSYWGSIPDYSGRARIPNLESQARLVRGSDGQLVVEAESLLDAARAVGFAHGQDRMEQMDILRRIGRGRLSELMGTRTIPIDRFMRTMNFSEHLSSDFAALEPRSRALLEAYAEGVNGYLAHHGDGVWSPLLQFTGASPPEPWSPEDSLLWGKVTALRLARNWRIEERNLELQNALGEMWEFLYPAETARVRTIGDVGGGVDFGGGGSNFWAVSPRRSASGSALFANDPHLDLTLPPVWYLVRIETPEGILAGATPPGLPLPLIGHSDHHAWGFTNHFGDTQDLRIEDEAYAFEERREVIAVRGGDLVEWTVREGRHGPVVSDIPDSRTRSLAAAGTVLTLSWPALEPGDTTADAVFDLALSRDLEDFRAAASRFAVPAQNLGYADTMGNIAIFTVGWIPRRVGVGGFVPTVADGLPWPEGMIPFDELPSFVNPPSGLITNSNDRLMDDSYPYFMGEDWLLPSRAERLRSVLESPSLIGMDAMRFAQLDIVSGGAREFLPFLLSRVSTDATALRGEDGEGEVGRALDLLRAWDGAMAADRFEPLLYHFWVLTLEGRLLALRLDAELSELALGTGWNRSRIRRLLDSEWCAEGICDGIVRESLESALDRLSEMGGEDLFALRWGDIHKAELSHPILGFDIPFSPWRRELSTGGADDTVNLALPETDGFSMRHKIGAGLRFIADLGALDESLFVTNSGQSGHPGSFFYDNLLGRWLAGDYIRLTLSDAERARAQVFYLDP